MPKKTSSYNSWLLKQLADPQRAASYLNVAINDSAEMFLTALFNVAKAQGVAKVAEGADVTREALYRMLSEEGNPRFDSLVGILNAVGLKLKVEAQEQSPSPVVPAGVPPVFAAETSKNFDFVISNQKQKLSSLPFHVTINYTELPEGRTPFGIPTISHNFALLGSPLGTHMGRGENAAAAHSSIADQYFVNLGTPKFKDHKSPISPMTVPAGENKNG